MKIFLFILLFVIPCVAVFWVSYKGYVNVKTKNKKENQNKNENETTRTSKGRK